MRALEESVATSTAFVRDFQKKEKEAQKRIASLEAEQKKAKSEVGRPLFPPTRHAGSFLHR